MRVYNQGVPSIGLYYMGRERLSQVKSLDFRGDLRTGVETSMHAGLMEKRALKRTLGPSSVFKHSTPSRDVYVCVRRAGGCQKYR